MNISVSQAQGRVPVTVIKLDGQLDGQTYQDLISKAKEAQAEGGRRLSDRHDRPDLYQQCWFGGFA